MNIVGDTGAYGRFMVVITVLGVAAGALAFFPSPLRLFNLFEEVPVTAVNPPPPLVIQKMLPLQDFDTITSHPLFNKGRLPDPVASASAPVSQPAAGGTGDVSQFRLVGIVGDSSMQLALVQKQGGSMVTLKPGDSLEGWTVERISAAGVAISGGGRKEFLTIPKAVNRAQSP